MFLIETRALQLGVLFFHLEKAFFILAISTQESERQRGEQRVEEEKWREKKMKERKKEKLRMTE